MPNGYLLKIYFSRSKRSSGSDLFDAIDKCKLLFKIITRNRLLPIWRTCTQLCRTVWNCVEMDGNSIERAKSFLRLPKNRNVFSPKTYRLYYIAFAHTKLNHHTYILACAMHCLHIYIHPHNSVQLRTTPHNSPI